LETYNHLLNQKIQPQFPEGEMKPIFIDYLKTWREMKVPHVRFNVVDRKGLLDAQRRPERFQDLIVRVAGYSAHFVELSKGLQDHVIERKEQKLA
jgi:formate C-acetyltransferase